MTDAATSTPGLDSLFVAGVNHRSAPVKLRERLAVEAARVGDALHDIQATGVAMELMLLSTCNRLELYGVAARPRDAAGAAFDVLCRERAPDAGVLAEHLYVRTGSDAVRHCFRVASSLDSMVVGEPQILGQVKAAFEFAREKRTVGSLLHRLLAQTFAVAKRVRTETELGRHAVSVSSAAVELAKKIFGALVGRGALLIGAGEMGRLAARHLLEEGAGPLLVTNRTWSRACEVTAELGGTAVPFETWPDALGRVDIVVTSAAVTGPIVRAADLREALARRTRPLFFIDIALPRNVDASVHGLPDVFCYDLDDLRQVIEANGRERQREARRAEAIVEAEVRTFAGAIRSLDAVPTIVSLREKVDAIRRQELARALARLPQASPETRAAIEAMSDRLVAKILHTPLAKLHESSRSGRASQLGGLIAELFALDRPGRGAPRPYFPPRSFAALGLDSDPR